MLEYDGREVEEEEEEAFILCKSTKQNEWQSTIHTVQKATGKA